MPDIPVFRGLNLKSTEYYNILFSLSPSNLWCFHLLHFCHLRAIAVLWCCSLIGNYHLSRILNSPAKFIFLHGKRYEVKTRGKINMRLKSTFTPINSEKSRLINKLQATVQMPSFDNTLKLFARSLVLQTLTGQIMMSFQMNIFI